LTTEVDNQTSAPQPVTLTGTLLSASCVGGSTSYLQTVTCGTGLTDCLTVAGLASGIWKHQVSAGVQQQYQKSIVLAADPNGVANTVSWRLFNTILTVDRTDDISANPTPHCPSVPGTQTCTLRQALSAAESALAPVLVQFDPVVFPAGTPTTIQLTQSASLPINGRQMAVDGTDPNGEPTLRGDAYNRVIELPASGATFVFENQQARVSGLFIQRPTLPDGATPGDIIRFDGTSGLTQQNLLVHCRIDGGGSSLTNKSAAHDCISGVNGAGLNWGGANVVQDTEVTACPDKGVKATSLAYVTVRDSWLHHNIGGGMQATLSGNVGAEHNVIEYNGYNATAQVFDANGVAVNGADGSTPLVPSTVHTDGNIIRNNGLRGISVQELSTATITNDLSCGASNSGTSGQNGIAIFNSTATPASATVRGTAAVYNGRNGATIANQSTGDFGQNSPDVGNNAFTQNATNPSLGGHNFDNSSTQANVPALDHQWQHCYADPAHPGPTCDGDIALDINGSAISSPAQPHRADAATLPVVIQRFSPTKAASGDWVHISGSGFNAIDGYPQGGNCTTTIQQNNTCSPMVGNCVQYEASPGVWVDLSVQSVTPTELVVQIPAGFTCAQPVTVRIQRLDYSGAIVTGTGTFCTNS
jgi:hypothetical protein